MTEGVQPKAAFKTKKGSLLWEGVFCYKEKEEQTMRSDNVTKGAERAPNRSLFYALGYTPEELERPLIGVVSAYSEIVPGHMNLDKVADAVKAGIQMAGGTPS